MDDIVRSFSLPQEPTENPTARFTAMVAGLLLLALPLAAIAGLAVWQKSSQSQATTYEECEMSPGSMLLESYPAICVTRAGARFPQTDASLVPTEPEVVTQRIATPYGQAAFVFPVLYSLEETASASATTLQLTGVDHTITVRGPVAARTAIATLRRSGTVQEMPLMTLEGQVLTFGSEDLTLYVRVAGDEIRSYDVFVPLASTSAKPALRFTLTPAATSVMTDAMRQQFTEMISSFSLEE